MDGSNQRRTFLVVKRSLVSGGAALAGVCLLLPLLRRGRLHVWRRGILLRRIDLHGAAEHILRCLAPTAPPVVYLRIRTAHMQSYQPHRHAGTLRVGAPLC